MTCAHDMGLTYSGQFVNNTLLLQDLKLEKGYLLVIVGLVQIVQ